MREKTNKNKEQSDTSKKKKSMRSQIKMNRSEAVRKKKWAGGKVKIELGPERGEGGGWFWVGRGSEGEKRITLATIR